MRILHLFSANIFTGSVEHATELAGYQQEQGHQVWLASDYLRPPNQLPHEHIPVHDLNAREKHTSLQLLKALLKKEQIQLVHCHSRAASKLAHRALKRYPAAQVSTVHGRQGIHLKAIRSDIFGQQIIAVSEALKTHLTEDLKKDARRISVIGNGIRLPELAATAAPPVECPLRISLIGRLSGPKGMQAARLFKEVFPVLLQAFPGLIVSIAGEAGGAMPGDGDMHLARLKKTFGNRVEQLGLLPDIATLIRSSRVIIGAGRVALKALGLQRPLLALGESACRGIATPQNVDSFFEDNFGDTGPATPFEAASVQQLLSDALQQPADAAALHQLAVWVRARCSLPTIAARIFRVYEKALGLRYQPKWMPVLMYHKVPLVPIDTPHRIFVTKAHFQRHLRYMRWLGKTPVTLEWYQQLCNGLLDHRKWPRRPVVLTFDDGYRDNFTNAWPLLQSRGWPAVLFALSDREATANHWDEAEMHLETSRLMSHEELQALIASGWELGAHTYSHIKLTGLSDAALNREAATSRMELQQQFGRQPVSFAYPFGDYDDAAKAAAEQAGYAFGVATDTGGLHIEDDRMAVFRVNIFPEDNFFAIAKKTASWYRQYYFRKRGK